MTHLDKIAEAIWRADHPESIGVRTWRDMVNKTHYRHLAQAVLDALGLHEEWAAADAEFQKLGGGVIESTIGRTPEPADRWMSVDEPGWIKVSRLTSTWRAHETKEGGA